MSNYILAWHSYDMNSTELEGNVVAAYESLAEAQYEMEQNFEETIGLFDSAEYTTQKHDTSMRFSTPYGYDLTYYVTELKAPTELVAAINNTLLHGVDRPDHTKCTIEGLGDCGCAFGQCAKGLIY